MSRTYLAVQYRGSQRNDRGCLTLSVCISHVTCALYDHTRYSQLTERWVGGGFINEPVVAVVVRRDINTVAIVL